MPFPPRWKPQKHRRFQPLMFHLLPLVLRLIAPAPALALGRVKNTIDVLFDNAVLLHLLFRLAVILIQFAFLSFKRYTPCAARRDRAAFFICISRSALAAASNRIISLHAPADTFPCPAISCIPRKSVFNCRYVVVCLISSDKSDIRCSTSLTALAAASWAVIISAILLSRVAVIFNLVFGQEVHAFCSLFQIMDFRPPFHSPPDCWALMLFSISTTSRIFLSSRSGFDLAI